MNKPTKRKSRIPRDAVIPHTSTPPLPVDNYEIPPHIDFDYSKAKPNRFAGRVRFTHGGKRNGAGRKPAPEPTVDRTVTLYKSHLKYLRKLDSNLSRAIRKLIDAKL